MQEILNRIKRSRDKLRFIRNNINVVKEAQIQDILSREYLDTAEYIEKDLRTEIKIRNIISSMEDAECPIK